MGFEVPNAPIFWALKCSKAPTRHFVRSPASDAAAPAPARRRKCLSRTRGFHRAAEAPDVCRADVQHIGSLGVEVFLEVRRVKDKVKQVSTCQGWIDPAWVCVFFCGETRSLRFYLLSPFFNMSLELVSAKFGGRVS